MKTVTLGMFAVGFLILVARISWFAFRSGRSAGYRGLIPFATSVGTFAAAGAAAGGLIGTVLAWVRGRIGDVGDWALTKGTGAKGVHATKPADFGTLTPFGAVIMLALLIIAFVAWRSARRRPKKEIAWGAPAGLTMGPFFGAVTIVPLINLCGAWLIGGFFR
ncbi:hypothetical protein ACEZDB_35710 [Streptacidiphilus sp. N1-3]|uniref:Prepilin type IV endopeptidase peptidase domain-containing protein n=1 Tax=Streptacidiphilus alkalitolerans TaxID=3342712 RepID=A0ABV6XCK1_9ACTN